jgi:hypothetical protein
MAAAPSCRGFAIDHIRGIIAAPAACGAMRYPSWVRLPDVKPFPVEPSGETPHMLTHRKLPARERNTDNDIRLWFPVDKIAEGGDSRRCIGDK